MIGFLLNFIWNFQDSNYSFKYHVDDSKTDDYHGHEESRQGNVVRGRYYVLLPDGIRQIVDYVADSTGYHPTITYERISRKNKQFLLTIRFLPEFNVFADVQGFFTWAEQIYYGYNALQFCIVFTGFLIKLNSENRIQN